MSIRLTGPHFHNPAKIVVNAMLYSLALNANWGEKPKAHKQPGFRVANTQLATRNNPRLLPEPHPPRSATGGWGPRTGIWKITVCKNPSGPQILPPTETNVHKNSLQFLYGPRSLVSQFEPQTGSKSYCKTEAFPIWHGPKSSDFPSGFAPNLSSILLSSSHERIRK